MKLSDGAALIAEYEKQAQKYKAAVEARKDLLAKLGSDTMGKLVDAFPTVEAFSTFAASMPESPALDAVIKAFPDPAEMTAFIGGALKGNVKVFAVLAEKGCGRDPKVLKQLADEFKLDPSALQNMVTEGGMGTQPEALAAMLQDGCASDPKKLKQVFGEFATKQDREKLAKSLGAGGLGNAPGALGALVKHDDGKLLKKLTADFETEPDKLRGVVAEGGCDGKSPNRPGLLTDVIIKGLGGDPKRLKELHAAFTPGTDNQLKDLNKLLTSLDGEDAKGGERLKTLLGTFAKQTANNNADAAKKLRDPYIASISKLSVTGGMPEVVGPNRTPQGIKAVKDRAPPPAEQRAGTLGTAIADNDVGALANGALTDPAARTAAASALGTASGLGQAAEEAGKQPLAGDPAQTQKTAEVTQQANEKLAEVKKRVDGAPAAETEALAKLGAAALEAARIEPDDNTRKAALAAAKAAEEGVIEALKRLAAAALAGSPNGAAAEAAQAAVAALPNDTPAGVTKAAKETAQAAMMAAAAAQGALADPAVSSVAAKEVLKNAGPQNEQAAREDAANNAAAEATSAALAMKVVVEKAPVPADSALLVRAAEAAAACLDKARQAPVQQKAQEGFDAAKLLTKAIDDAVKDATARLALAATQTSTDGKAALVAANDADVANDLVKRLAGTSTIKTAGLAQLEKAAAAARNIALTAADTEKMLAGDKAAQKKNAEDAAYRSASAAKNGAQNQQDVTNATGKGNNDATAAAQAATVAKNSLTTYVLTNLAQAAAAVVRDGYIKLIEDGSKAAEAALAAARGAADDVIRTNALNAAKACAAEVAGATKKLSAAMAAMAKTELTTTQGTKITAGVGQASATAEAVRTGTNVPTALSQGQQAFDAGKAAIADTAATALAEYARSDPAVTAANEKVATALAKAEMPGADEAAKLALALAKRDAAKALATKAKDVLLAGMGALGLPTPPVAAIPEATATVFAAALTDGKAANTAVLAWHSAALKAQQVATTFQTALKAIKTATKEETEALKAADDAVAKAQAEVDAAALMLTLVGEKIRDITNNSKQWSQRANNVTTPSSTGGTKIKNIAGFGVAMGEEANPKASPMPEEDLIRIGATLMKEPYTGTHSPTTDPVTVNGQTYQVDSGHVNDRHIRETYPFDGEAAPIRSRHDVGTLLEGALSGKSGKSTGEADLIEQGKRDKPNSFMPEEVTQTNLTAWVQAALTALEADKGKTARQILYEKWYDPNPAPIAPPPIPAASAKNFVGVWVEEKATVGKPTASKNTSVTIGLNMIAAPVPPIAANVQPRARMFYGNSRDKPSTGDILVIAKALNYPT